jgi:hypothetical protein
MMGDEPANSHEPTLPDDKAADRIGLSATELERQLDELSFDAPPLPADFSREDIYLDHD